MKVLCLSITAGNGHNATAKAVQDYLDSQGVETRFLDTFKYLSKFIAATTENVFLFTSKYAKKPYAMSFTSLEKTKRSSEYAPTREAAKFLAPKLKDYIEAFDPDVIISSHVFPCMIMDVLKSKYKTLYLHKYNIVLL